MRWIAGALSGLAFTSCALAVAAEPRQGEVYFFETCAGCHGPGALGDGPTAALLSVPVPDLTRIARQNDGVFDPARVIRMIDGRDGLAAHGGPMPMFGGLLTGPSVVIDGPDGSPISTTAPILSIVDWLETIQEE
ncbi:cytochrome c [Tropicimonas sp. TH_r6]|uniref:c-type cytochrome n=1 Tax=Tropicimonas sp. TH_r6 TaxID=3082085 RepID=UPI0029554294|nr:cytochrome c [Tropicimonas sp. TH_r6]MDV7142639.1 cytochrome c [Tropicimonas sp. TH_r6]